MTEENILTKNILLKRNLRVFPIELIELGGTIFIRELSGIEREKLGNIVSEEDISSKEDNQEMSKGKIERASKMRTTLALWSICDKEGNNIFDNEKEVESFFANNSQPVLDKIYDAIFEKAGLNEKKKGE